MEHLRLVLEIIKNIGFKLKKEKCKFVQNKVEFLGFTVVDGLVTIPLQQKLRTMDWVTSRSKKDVRAFNGFSAFFSKFIQNYAEKMIPLYDTIRGKKHGKFEMTEAATGAFTTSSCRNKLHFTEKECLAIVWAVKKLRIYITREFTIRTDHQALKWLLNLKDSTGRLMRWILALQEYNYVIKHIPGTKNVMADALSRIVMISKGVEKDKEMTAEENPEVVLRNHLECGHGGVEATYVLTLRETSWKGTCKDIISIPKGCSTCNRHCKGQTPLQKYRLSLTNPLDKIGIDLVGPLPKSYDGNRYIVIATDYVTGWCEADAIKTKSSNMIAKFLVEKIFLIHGSQREILQTKVRNSPTG
ncbi:endonuclease [Vairimorpha necatrix]|uniref:Endonuclease n=1 Tax=Vairimorpha necatrix TaxID=6039 RepID=A0AAX4JFD4_9MICR